MIWSYFLRVAVVLRVLVARYKSSQSSVNFVYICAIMEAVIAQQESHLVQEAATNMFVAKPQNNRYVRSELHSYNPTSAINEKNDISFHLGPWYSPSFYLLNEMLLEVDVRLCKKNGDDLTKDCDVR